MSLSQITWVIIIIIIIIKRTQASKGVGNREEEKKEGDWEERVRDACSKNPLLFITVDAGVRKFLIG